MWRNEYGTAVYPPITSSSSALATAVTPHLSHVTKRIGHGRTPTHLVNFIRIGYGRASASLSCDKTDRVRPYPPPISSISLTSATAVSPPLSHVTKRIQHGRTPIHLINFIRIGYGRLPPLCHMAKRTQHGRTPTHLVNFITIGNGRDPSSLSCDKTDRVRPYTHPSHQVHQRWLRPCPLISLMWHNR